MANENGKQPMAAVREPAAPTGVAAQQASQVPPVVGSVTVAGWDPQAPFGAFPLLNLDTFRQLQVLAERLHALGRVVAEAEAEIEEDTEAPHTVRARIEVPADQVWYVNRAVLVSPAQSDSNGEVVEVSFRVSIWPDTADEPDPDGARYAAPQGTVAADTFTIDFPAQGELGEELRLPGGSKVTLVARLTESNAGGDLEATLTLFGRVGKKLV